MKKKSSKKLPLDSFFPKNSAEPLQDCSSDEDIGRLIESVFSHSGFKCVVQGIHHGPSITLFELSMDGSQKVSAIQGLSDKLAMVLESESVRILAPIPGKNAIGVEVPNKERIAVGFGSMVKSLESEKKMRIPVALGMDVYGKPMLMDLTRCPHLLVGGMNGEERTSFLDSLICSILCSKTADEVRLILVDTKVVELSVYNGVPHLLSPVITDTGMAFKALDFVVRGLERRLELLTGTGSRKIEEYNAKTADNPEMEKLPYIVVVIDDYGDLIQFSGKEFEQLMKRITSVARFCGIHLVLSTKRVSADVVTGVIKSNIPTQIAFAVPNVINSRILIDQPGAEILLGGGDMLYNNPMCRHPFRIQGVSLGSEIEKITRFLRTQGKTDLSDELFIGDAENE